jgi:hypothetical protein
MMAAGVDEDPHSTKIRGWRMLKLPLSFFDSDEPGGNVIASLGSAIAEVAGTGQEQWVHPQLLTEVENKPTACEEDGRTCEEGEERGPCAVTVPFVYLAAGDRRQSSASHLDVAEACKQWRYQEAQNVTPFPTHLEHPHHYLQFWLAVADQWQLREASEASRCGKRGDPIRHQSLVDMERFYRTVDQLPGGGEVVGLPPSLCAQLKGWTEV